MEKKEMHSACKEMQEGLSCDQGFWLGSQSSGLSPSSVTYPWPGLTNLCSLCFLLSSGGSGAFHSGIAYSVHVDDEHPGIGLSPAQQTCSLVSWRISPLFYYLWCSNLITMNCKLRSASPVQTQKISTASQARKESSMAGFSNMPKAGVKLKHWISLCLEQ